MDIIVCGVGGQGILTLTNILSAAAVMDDFNVRGAEVHGMAQRGGSVVTHIRIGECYSPLVMEGTADLLMGLEPMEALRNLIYLSRNGSAVVNLHPIIPPHLIRGGYPSIEQIKREIEANCRAFFFDCLKLALKAGSHYAVNMVILGLAFGLKLLPLSEKSILNAVKVYIPRNFLDLNVNAFKLGVREGERILESVS